MKTLEKGFFEAEVFLLVILLYLFFFKFFGENYWSKSTITLNDHEKELLDVLCKEYLEWNIVEHFQKITH